MTAPATFREADAARMIAATIFGDTTGQTIRVANTFGGDIEADMVAAGYVIRNGNGGRVLEKAVPYSSDAVKAEVKFLQAHGVLCYTPRAGLLPTL